MACALCFLRPDLEALAADEEELPAAPIADAIEPDDCEDEPVADGEEEHALFRRYRFATLSGAAAGADAARERRCTGDGERRLQHGYPMLGWRDAGSFLMRRHAGGYQFDPLQIRPFPYLQRTTQVPEMYRVEASSVNANAGRHEGCL